MKQLMKRLVFALALTLSVLGMKQSVFAENIIYVNETTFPDKVFREAVLEQWELNKPDDFKEDDKSTNSKTQVGVKIDADLIENIWIDSNENHTKITNIKGIELLTKIRDIDISKYYGDKFDLSRNTELNKVAICSKKYELSPKDFTCLKQLRELKLSGKLLPNFDCSGLNNLGRLYIHSTSDLIRLDVSKCKKMCSLSVQADSLVSVNLGHARPFRYVKIEGAKGLSSIDVSKLVNLEQLSLSDCNIKKLDVSKSKNLKELNLGRNRNIRTINLKYNKKLYYVNIASTSISKLDTSSLKKLEYLEVDNAKISSLNLRNNTKLKNLSVVNTPIKKLDVTKNKHLDGINISGSKIKSMNLKNQSKLLALSYSYGQKITYPTKIGNLFSIEIDRVKKGQSIAVPSFCKGYKFYAEEGDPLKYKNNKILTSKNTKNDYQTAFFIKGDKLISFTIEYK